jgi:hypothetical protein
VTKFRHREVYKVKFMYKCCHSDRLEPNILNLSVRYYLPRHMEQIHAEDSRHVTSLQKRHVTSWSYPGNGSEFQVVVAKHYSGCQCLKKALQPGKRRRRSTEEDLALESSTGWQVS